MARLAKSIADFPLLRENGYLYADKTELLYKLVSQPAPYFLSRPRRFGKTLLVSALKAILEGRKQLFEGLWISGSDYDWEPRPVISLDFNLVDIGDLDGFRASLCRRIKSAAELHHIELDIEMGLPEAALYALITSLYLASGQKAAVLIDDYDAPILGSLRDKKLAEGVIQSLIPFYGALKAASNMAGLVFITGVTDLSQTIRTDNLNHVWDLTLHDDYAAICGFTPNELDSLFSETIIASLERLKANRALAPGLASADLRQKILALYGGYSWDEKTRVLNPWSALSCFHHGRLGKYFRQSGCPRLLIERIAGLSEKLNFFSGELTEWDGYNLEDVGASKIDPVSLMIQTGCLAVRTGVDHPSPRHLLDFPNLEVRAELTPLLLELGQNVRFDEPLAWRKLAKEALAAIFERDPDKFSRAFGAFLAAFPHCRPDQKEAYYCSLFAAAMLLAGPSPWTIQPPKGEGPAVIEREETGEVFILEIACALGPLSLSAALSAAKKRMEERKASLFFRRPALRICKAALAISEIAGPAIDFEEAANWRLEPSCGRYAIKTTNEDPQDGRPSP